MLTNIHFREPFTSVVRTAVIHATSTSLVLATLHFFNEIAFIGELQSIFIPIIMVCIDLLQAVLFKSFIVSVQKKNFTSMLLKCMLLTVISICIFFILAILYGAPAFTEHEQTLMFAIYLTTCSTIHCLINMGLTDFNVMLTRQNATNAIELNASQVVAMVTIVTCWLSAVVIPLDWDRWWQKWPIPCVIGALLGYIFGHLITIILAAYNYEYYIEMKKRCI